MWHLTCDFLQYLLLLKKYGILHPDLLAECGGVPHMYVCVVMMRVLNIFKFFARSISSFGLKNHARIFAAFFKQMCLSLKNVYFKVVYKVKRRTHKLLLFCQKFKKFTVRPQFVFHLNWTFNFTPFFTVSYCNYWEFLFAAISD